MNFPLFRNVPNVNCPVCHGDGTVNDMQGDGWGQAVIEEVCDCVFETCSRCRKNMGDDLQFGVDHYHYFDCVICPECWAQLMVFQQYRDNVTETDQREEEYRQYIIEQVKKFGGVVQ